MIIIVDTISPIMPQYHLLVSLHNSIPANSDIVVTTTSIPMPKAEYGGKERAYNTPTTSHAMGIR